MSCLLRRFIFIFFLLVFILITPCLLLYAKGYSFDWQKKSLTKTGALYLKSYPKNAQVFIDGKLANKAPCLINHLIPGKYEVTLRLPGFQVWRKQIEISEGLLNEVRQILLVPHNPSLKLLAIKESAQAFSLNNQGDKMLYLNPDNNTVFYLNTTQMVQQKLYTSTSSPEFVSWSPDNNKILIKEDNLWQIIDFRSFKISRLRPPSQKSIQKITWHPSNKNKIFFLQDNTLLSQDLKLPSPSLKLIDDVVEYTISDNYIFYLKKPGFFLYQSDLTGRNQKQLSQRPFLQDKVSNSKLIISRNNQIALLLDKTLYLYQEDKRYFEMVQESVKTAIFSPDNKKLAILATNELWVLYLTDQLSQPIKTSGQKDLITRLSQEILQAIWHPFDSSHLVYVTSDKIKIAEIDNRDQINIFDFLEVKNPQIQYCEKTKQLYFINDKKLFSVELL